MILELVRGDLLAQPVEVIVNAWNRNLLPWWLLRPSGVSGAIKRAAGDGPFRELARVGRLRLGEAVLTGAGRLPQRGIIHAATITPFGRSTAPIVAGAVERAMALVIRHGFASVAFPLLGSGSGGLPAERSLEVMRAALAAIEYAGRVVLVRVGGDR